ncbi:MAG: BMP family ABC transporter substrate-binding protein, partial [Pseudomonadales bacterium]|nr:BMP family ABC transporter substrate-binding protein [Pseudomonadales bacterium]
MIKISRLLKGFLTTATLIICAVLPLQVQADRPLKVGFVYVSPAGGSGWTYAHDQARKHIESKFGKQVNVTVLENIAEGAEAA